MIGGSNRRRTGGRVNERDESDRTQVAGSDSVSPSVSSPSRTRTRGQTTQDFAVGIGIFILAIAFVFAFLPSIVTPYDTSTGGAETAQADRIADRVVENLSTGGSPNELDGDKFEDVYIDGDLAELVGLRADTSEDIHYDHVSIRVEPLNVSRSDEGPLESGSEDLVARTTEYDDQAAASSARVVTFEDETFVDGEEPPYRLVVRVW
ncbi:hypothetical protein SAMN05444422_104301 [Halobiforma haloterrestris]|uniref:Uncharacterized protein n=1 Tax=Natronobacterium haloterrestre TaxID=148448 RepID=A0A1I1GHE2_NATHA|nr:hypothetical protein SAMN05444422_104301 [Halobiforma haloterrestris]